MSKYEIRVGGRGRGKMKSLEEWLNLLPKEAREKVIIVKASDKNETRK